MDLDPSSLFAIVVAVCSKTVPFASELAVVAVLGCNGLSGAWLVRVVFACHVQANSHLGQMTNPSMTEFGGRWTDNGSLGNVGSSCYTNYHDDRILSKQNICDPSEEFRNELAGQSHIHKKPNNDHHDNKRI